MRLPLKFRPLTRQLVADVIGAAVMIGFGLVFFGNYASPEGLRRYASLGAWLEANRIELPFMLGSIVLLLSGLGWFTVALINLVADSPFNHLIVDRQGITYRNFWRENRYSWKDLGPVHSFRTSAWQGRSSQRRCWIVADTLGTEAGGGSHAFWSNPAGSLRIPATVYLGGGWLVGGGELAAHDAAGWLEELRQLARSDRLEADDVPPPPAGFRPPIEIAYGGAPPPSTEAAATGATVER